MGTYNYDEVRTSTTPDRLSHANIRTILEAWFDKHTLDSFPWITVPKWVEVPVAMPLRKWKTTCLCGHRLRDHDGTRETCDLCDCNQYRDTIIHVGKLDLLAKLRRDPSVLCPVDHKSTGQLNGRFVAQFQIDSQLTGYMADAGYHCDTPPHKLVAYVNAIELSILPTSERKCGTHKVPYEECGPLHMKCQVIGPIERSKGQIEEWKDTAVDLAKRHHMLLSYNERLVHQLRMEGTFNGSCGYCEFREWCLQDRSYQQIDGMFSKTPWTPWDHAALPPPKPNELYVDNSILKSVATCSTQDMMRYGKSWTSESQGGPLHAGTALHKAMEVWFGGASATRALRAFDEAYEEA